MRKTTRRKAAPAKKRPVKKAAKPSTRRTTRTAASKRTSAKPVRKTKKTMRGIGGKEWTPAEVKYLRTAYKNTPTNNIADKLNRTLSSVRSKAVALSLKKAAPKKAAAKKAAPRKAASKRTTTRRKTRW